MSRDDLPSRSARKRDSEALQALGERLVSISEPELAKIPLPEELADAVAIARRIRERSGRRRQLQYIGKLMRRIDATTIEAALTGLDQKQQRDSHALHQAERWRERLIAEGEAAVNALMAEHPHADRTRLLHLARDARAEAAGGHPPRATRELFRYLRDEALPADTRYE